MFRSTIRCTQLARVIRPLAAPGRATLMTTASTAGRTQSTTVLGRPLAIWSQPSVWNQIRHSSSPSGAEKPFKVNYALVICFVSTVAFITMLATTVYDLVTAIFDPNFAQHMQANRNIMGDDAK